MLTYLKYVNFASGVKEYYLYCTMVHRLLSSHRLFTQYIILTTFGIMLGHTCALFHGPAYRKHRIGAYSSNEFCAYGKGISRVSGEFWLLRVRSPR